MARDTLLYVRLQTVFTVRLNTADIAWELFSLDTLSFRYVCVPSMATLRNRGTFRRGISLKQNLYSDGRCGECGFHVHAYNALFLTLAVLVSAGVCASGKQMSYAVTLAHLPCRVECRARNTESTTAEKQDAKGLGPPAPFKLRFFSGDLLISWIMALLNERVQAWIIFERSIANKRPATGSQD